MKKNHSIKWLWGECAENESVFLEIHHAANMKINDKGSRMKIVKKYS